MKMKEKEIVIPIRFPVKVGKITTRIGGELGASISIKTKWPISLAYFYLAFKAMVLGIKKSFA